MKKKNVLVLFMIFITISFSVFSKNDKVAKGEMLNLEMVIII